MSKAPPTGKLVLVPNTLDLGTTPEPLDTVLSREVMRRAASLTCWVVENAKTARSFLKRVDAVEPLCMPLQNLQITELPRARKGDPKGQVATAAWLELLAPAFKGLDIGLLSEAGLPAVADPGAALVHAAHEAGIVVEPLAGASALTLGLAASGLNGQRFAFEGYLPQQADARAQRVRELEQRSRREAQTQIVIETPYRNTALMSALVQLLNPQTRLSVACGLTSTGGWCRTRSVAQWRAEGMLSLPADLPAVFMWLAD
ncbi:SAM-dependent methyltransferase [Ideonella sp.]|uniref:SAM-dependent methyltransferase n=1 Tax=Ideonella sp. TaxID=1929293 RepID=UPI003BB8091C